MLAANGSGAPRDRARSGRRVRGDRARRAAAGHVEVGERGGARPAVAAGRTRGDARRPLRRARARRPDRPGARRLEPAGAVARATAATRCCSRTTAARRATASRTATRSTVGGASSTSPTSRPGSSHAVKEGWADAGPRRAHGRQRGRLHGAERRRAASRPRRGRDRAVSRSPTCSISPRRRTASSRATRRGWSARCPTRATRTSTARRSRTRREIRAPVLLLQGDDDTVVNRRAQSAAFADALRARGRDGRAPRVRGRGPRLAPRRRRRRRARAHRRVPRRGSVLTDASARYQGPKRGADRAVLLAHGAGADMHAATLTTVADALADAKVPSLRFNFPYQARRAARARPPAGARSRGARGRGRARAAREAAAGAARARRPFDGRAHLLDGRGRRRDALPRSVSCCSAIRCTRRASRSSSGSSTSRGLRMPALFVSGHPRRLRHAGRAEATREEAEGPGHVPLDRDRRPRLQAPEVERADRRRRCSPTWPRRSSTSLRGLPTREVTDSRPCESTGGSRSSTSRASRRSATSSATTSRCGCSRCSAARCARSRPTSACASPSGSATAACWCRSTRRSSSPRCAKLEAAHARARAAAVDARRDARAAG